MDRDKLVSKLINLDNISDLKIFVSSNKSDYFRYFNSRGYDVILNHTYTSLYYLKDDIVGYGHLDVENNITWLGIMVSDENRGKGYGEMIMNDLIENSTEDIHLTVDISNKIAYNLYKKIGFNVIEENKNHYLMVYKKK
jgi:ribosomal protein S18 acetylase RimI-like enzyme